LYGGYVFDVEIAKAIASQYDSHLIPSHRSVAGLRLQLTEEEYDLGSPVIFLSFLKPGAGGLGVLLIDGNHRMQWAAKHHLPLEAVFLNPIDSFRCAGDYWCRWENRWIWRKLVATARHYGVTFRHEEKQ